MELCRFCLESIPQDAFACGHCGRWQPTREEINSVYKKVLAVSVNEEMGVRKRRALNILICVGLLSVILLLFVVANNERETSSKLIIGFLFFFSLSVLWLYNRIVRKYRIKIVFEKILFLEERLQERLKELQIKKFQPHNKPSSQSSLLILGILLLLAISNPSTNEFKEFYKNAIKSGEEPSGITKTNLVICSRYKINGTTYWGVLGNFF